MTKEEFLAYYKEAVIHPDDITTESLNIETVSYKGMSIVFQDDKPVALTYEYEGITITIPKEFIFGNILGIQKMLTEFAWGIADIRDNDESVSEEQIVNALESMGLELPKG